MGVRSVILDYVKEALGNKYTVLDAQTGKSLDDDLVFYVDSDRGFYRHYIKGPSDQPYYWDRRTKEQAIEETPKKYLELAWKQVNRSVVIFLREEKEEGGC
jgi:hypothetical protein